MAANPSSEPHRRSDAFANVNRIVAAARDVFAREGASATLSQIAARAGVGNATLYRHFPNRQALAVAVYEDVFVTEVEPAMADLGGEAPRDALIEVLTHLEDVMYEQRPLLASLDHLAEVTMRLLRRNRESFDELVRRAQDIGDLRRDVTPDDVATFVAMVTTASVAMNQPKPLRRRYLSLMVDALTARTPQELPGGVTADAADD